jgi:MscS family membrane protein
MPLWDSLSPQVQDVILRVLLALLALLLIFLLRRVLTWLVLSPLRRAVERTQWRADDVMLEIAVIAVRYFIIAFGIYIAAQILQLGDIFIERLVRTFVIIGVTMGFYRAVGVIALSQRQLRNITGLSIEDELLPFVRTALRLVIIAIALVIVIQEWGYDVSGLIAGLGLGGLAFSLAAKDTVENLFGFTAVVGDRPFVEGEVIRIEGAEGKVENVGLRSTRIRQPDQSLVTVPNSKMTTSAIVNLSRLSKRRYVNRLGIDYWATSAQMRTLLSRIRQNLTKRPNVEKETVQAFFVKFGENALEIEITCYIRLADYAQFSAESEDINLSIIDLIEELGLEMAMRDRTITIETPFSIKRDEQQTNGEA